MAAIPVVAIVSTLLFANVKAELMARPSLPGKDPSPMPCTASAIRFWEAQRSCERHGRKGTNPSIGSAVPKRRDRFRAMCRETSWIMTATKDIRYMHMVSLALLPDGHTIIAAWQAAPNEEGESTQMLMSAVSQTDGRKWTRRRHVAVQGAPYPRGRVAAPVAWRQDAPLTETVAAGSLQVRGPQESRPFWGPALVTTVAPLSQNNNSGDLLGAASSHRATTQRTWMFFSVTQNCRRVFANATKATRWSPGGDIMATYTTNGHDWSNPAALMQQSAVGSVPFVTANSPAIGGGGQWVLPFWGEAPRGSSCQWESASAAAGVLISNDYGASWKASRPIQVDGTWLIEGTIVPLDQGELLQLFRTESGNVYKSVSLDGGMTWSSPKPTVLPNPNSKVAAIVLSNGEVAVAYNAHDLHSVPYRARSHLYVALSSNRGATWRELARLESEVMPGRRFHYPALLQVHCKLLVAYSVGFARGYIPDIEKGPPSGIKLTTIHLDLGS